MIWDIFIFLFLAFLVRKIANNERHIEQLARSVAQLRWGSDYTE